MADPLPDTSRRPIRYEYRIPTPSQYNALRRDAGWPEMDPDTVRACLPNSLYLVCAYQGERPVGMGRVVGDGGLCFYIQDVIVLESHQGMGVGKAIMDLLMEWIGVRAVKDSYLGLMAAVKKEGFYQRYGFTSRPTEDLGAGMTRFWEEG